MYGPKKIFAMANNTYCIQILEYAAGAIVTKYVPAHCAVGGVPAKVISEHVEWR